jgi:hypothetical protein
LASKHKRRSGPVKVSVVGNTGGAGPAKIWRRERIVMAEPDMDDVAFLTGTYIYTDTQEMGDRLADARHWEALYRPSEGH